MKMLRLAALLATVSSSLAGAGERGPVTDLPMPRYVSMKASEGYARRGPSPQHRIDWVFRHRGTPVRIVDEYGHWRRVMDRDGQGGWMHYSLLSGTRTVVVTGEGEPLRRRPGPDAAAAALVEAGVIARLRGCAAGWCRVEAGGAEGWLPADAVWGVGDAEAER